jgi:hypothetical protein
MWEQLPSGRVEHRFESVVLAAALALIPVLIVENFAKGQTWQDVAWAANWLIWAVFAASSVPASQQRQHPGHYAKQSYADPPRNYKQEAEQREDPCSRRVVEVLLASGVPSRGREKHERLQLLSSLTPPLSSSSLALFQKCAGATCSAFPSP